MDNGVHIHRILDANLNRLREGLRVVEEYFRFVAANPASAVRLKAMRHAVHEMEQSIGPRNLLAGRDTAADPLASDTRPEELRRETTRDVLAANFKRAQEASRVLEEYAKAGGYTAASVTAKKIRFDLYDCEKEMMSNGTDG